MKNIYDKFPKTIEITKKPSFFGFFEIWGKNHQHTDRNRHFLSKSRKSRKWCPWISPTPHAGYKCPLVTAPPPIYLVTLYATKNSASLPKIKKSK